MKKQQYITTTFSTFISVVVSLSAVVTHFIPPLHIDVMHILLCILYQFDIFSI